MWIEKGDQVLLMIDSNENLVNNKYGSFRYTMESIGLNELILSQDPRLTPPPTRTPRTHKIDGIFGTPALAVPKCGYDTFVGFTDHCLSWVVIYWDSALGIFQKIQRTVARYLQCDGLRSMAKYVHLLESFLEEAHIFDTVLDLEANNSIPLNKKDAELFKTLDIIITKCMKRAEKSAASYTWVELLSHPS